jgi:hypothetical protein
MPIVSLSTPTHKLLRKLVFNISESKTFGRPPSNDEVVYSALLLLSEKKAKK